MSDDGDDTTPSGPAPGRRGGRPLKLTEAVVAAAVALLVQGNFRSAVAKRLSIGERTFQRWMRLGVRFPDGLYGRLRRSVLLAEAEAEVHAVARITAAGAEDWRAAVWFLERKYPQRWGKHRGELVELKRDLAELRKLIAPEAPPADPGRPS